MIALFSAGMNFYDFFMFLAHISFANLVQLCNLFKETGNRIWSSSPMAQHLTLNLVTIQKIALKMKSKEELTRNYRFHLDLRQTLDGPEFSKLCSVLGTTYGMIHKQQKLECETNKVSMDAIRDLNIIGTFSSQHCTNPEDLVKFIEHAFTNLRGICNEDNFLQSKLNDA